MHKAQQVHTVQARAVDCFITQVAFGNEWEGSAFRLSKHTEWCLKVRVNFLTAAKELRIVAKVESWSPSGDVNPYCGVKKPHAKLAICPTIIAMTTVATLTRFTTTTTVLYYPLEVGKYF